MRTWLVILALPDGTLWQRPSAGVTRTAAIDQARRAMQLELGDAATGATLQQANPWFGEKQQREQG